MRSLVLALMSVASIWASLSSCLVDSRCQNDYDCDGAQRCSMQGSCVLECAEDVDCNVNGVNIGKRCIDNRCSFLYDERVSAPALCLPVINPMSVYYEEELCLEKLEGKVVLLYFGQLT